MNVPVEFCYISTSVQRLLERCPKTPISHSGWERDLKAEESILKHNLLSDLQGKCRLGTMPQVLRKHNCYRTLQRVSLVAQNTHMHIELTPALNTGFPNSNSGSQSRFPSCSVAWPGNCKWHCSEMLARVNNTVPEAPWSLLPRG